MWWKAWDIQNHYHHESHGSKTWPISHVVKPQYSLSYLVISKSIYDNAHTIRWFYVIVLISCAHKWWYSVHWILRVEIYCKIYFPIMWISRKKAMLIFPLWINVRSLNAYIIHILFIHAIYYFKEKKSPEAFNFATHYLRGLFSGTKM